MSILITGGLGYIASHCIVELQHNDIIIIDNLSNSNLMTLDNIKKITNKNYFFYEGDIKNENFLMSIFSNHTITAVIHFAAYKSVSESCQNPLKYYDNNIGGLINLLKCMNQFNIKKIIFSSSATVYGQPSELPLTENANINILNPYGQTKNMAELILKDCVKAYDITAICLRYFNPVGAHPSGLLGETPKDATNLFPVILSVIRKEKSWLDIYGNDYNTKDGTAVRDYIHVVDLAKAHGKALSIEKGFHIFNIGTGYGYSVLEIVKCFNQYINVPYQYKQRREGDTDIIYADSTKANKILNWYPVYTLEDMIKDSLNSIKY